MVKYSKLRGAGACAVLCAAALLGACGGDDDDTPPATSQVPASASQSVAGFIGYLQVLVASEADTLEPVDTSGVIAPIDETSEPAVIN